MSYFFNLVLNGLSSSLPGIGYISDSYGALAKVMVGQFLAHGASSNASILLKTYIGQ